jgi:hypothetical protein
VPAEPRTREARPRSTSRPVRSAIHHGTPVSAGSLSRSSAPARLPAPRIGCSHGFRANGGYTNSAITPNRSAMPASRPIQGQALGPTRDLVVAKLEHPVLAAFRQARVTEAQVRHAVSGGSERRSRALAIAQTQRRGPAEPRHPRGDRISQERSSHVLGADDPFGDNAIVASRRDDHRSARSHPPTGMSATPSRRASARQSKQQPRRRDCFRRLKQQRAPRTMPPLSSRQAVAAPPHRCQCRSAIVLSAVRAPLSAMRRAVLRGFAPRRSALGRPARGRDC